MKQNSIKKKKDTQSHVQTEKKQSRKQSVSAKKQIQRTIGYIDYIKSHWIPMMAVGMFIGLFALSVVQLFRHTRQVADYAIVQDMQRLGQIFDQINVDCGVVGFEHERSYVDFLNVEKFAGSEVGAMNLLYPDKWQGPYVHDNPTVHEQQYVVVGHNTGYYLVPGDGVKLSTGKVVGVDIILDAHADLPAMLAQGGDLHTSIGVLGRKLSVGRSTLKKQMQQGFAAMY